MQNASQQYVLTDEKFKKTAKNIQRKIMSLTPENTKIPTLSLYQVLSNELFGMPYEEAKATILQQGVPLIGRTKQSLSFPEGITVSFTNEPDVVIPNPTSNPNEKSSTKEDLEQMRKLLGTVVGRAFPGMGVDGSDHFVSAAIFYFFLKEHINTADFQELDVFRLFSASLDDQFTMAFTFLAESEFSHYTKDLWLIRNMGVIRVVHDALVGQALNRKQAKPTISDVIKPLLSLRNTVDLALSEDVPQRYQSGLVTLLSSIGYDLSGMTKISDVQKQIAEEQHAYATSDALSLLKGLRTHVSAVFGANS